MKRFELEDRLGPEKMFQLYKIVKRSGEVPEISDDINQLLRELIQLENFYFSN